MIAGTRSPLLPFTFATATERLRAAEDRVGCEHERTFRWPLGRRPDDHPGLSSFGF